MNRRTALALVRLYPRAWRERYGAEFEGLLEDGAGGLGTALDVMVSALGERVTPTTGDDMTAGTSRMENWSARAPWAVFGIAPVGLLAVAYTVCLFILWSGWRMFLPAEQMPFVPVDGWAIFYFGVGRVLYFGAPLMVGCIIAWAAARAKAGALWPVLGMVLIALLGGAAKVRASRPTVNEPGHVGMAFTTLHPGYSAGVLALAVLLYALLRMRRGRVRAA
jgi:hypothetical protein